MGGAALGGMDGANWGVGEELGGREGSATLTTSSYNSSGPSSSGCACLRGRKRRKE